MLRRSLLGANNLTTRNLNVYDHLTSNGPHIPSIRWKRKPIWLPTAKTKVFRVPQRPVIPIEDKLELQRLYNNYRTLIKSLSTFFVEREQAREVELDPDIISASKKQDFEICNYQNNAWNKQVAAIRKERLARERAERIQEISAKLEAKKERDIKIQERVDSEIRKVKEEALSFVTAENIDETIKNALENITDHNFAIDLDGNVYKDQSASDKESKIAS